METKTCQKCKILKLNKEFYYKNKEKRLCSWCKECTKLYQKKRWTSKKIDSLLIMGNKCTKCGYCNNYAALEFHHLNPEEKDFDWKKMKLHPWSDIINELKKCVLLCSNCHREAHNPDCFMHGGNNSINFCKTSLMSTNKLCPECSAPVYNTTFCSKICRAASRRKVERPNRERLLNLINNFSYVEIGKMFNVSDNCIRKWAKYYGII